jgi:hypothetical protein
MLFPRSHAWTPLQKALITLAVVTALAAFTAAVYRYERYHRGPDDSVLFGTWQCVDVCYYPLYYKFTPDHNVEVLDFEDASSVIAKGRWYAGGDFIYLRFTQPALEFEGKREVLIWRIEEITPTEIRARLLSDEPPRVYRRVDLAAAHASNQTLQPTAGRRDARL